MPRRNHRTHTEDVQMINDPRTGEATYAVVPIAEYRALVAAAEDRADAATVDAGRAYLAAGGETFPAALVDLIMDGAAPVRAYREYRKLTQRQLAEKAGVRQATVSELEGGQLGTVATMRRIAKALQVDLDLLLPAVEA